MPGVVKIWLIPVIRKALLPVSVMGMAGSMRL
jgi:hypothetical protein